MSKPPWYGYPCILWPGPFDGDGYAVVKINYKRFRVSRVFGEIKFGPLKSEQLICHHCDVPQCVQPMHFFVGSRSDNNKDMVAKGRNAKGCAFPQAKLNPEIVAKIRNEYKLRQNGGAPALARKYGVCTTTIVRVVKGINWKEKGLPTKKGKQ
jgi:hypothetical protein